MKHFYTYLHCKPNGDPFYVGKGYGSRSHNFLHSSRNKFHRNIVAKYGAENIVVLIFKKDSEESAFASEKRFIKILRNAGFELCNQTDGGEGLSGMKFSIEHRKKISLANIGKVTSLETRKRLSLANIGKKASAETRAKIAAKQIGRKGTMLGKKFSIETRKKMSASKMGNKNSLGRNIGNKNALGAKHTSEMNTRKSERQIEKAYQHHDNITLEVV